MCSDLKYFFRVNERPKYAGKYLFKNKLFWLGQDLSLMCIIVYSKMKNKQ